MSEIDKGTVLLESKVPTEQDKDFEKIRDTLFDLLEKGKDAVELSMAIAKQTECPKLVSTIPEMLNEVGKISMSISKLYETKHKLETTGKVVQNINNENHGTVNNINWTGTSRELNERLKRSEIEDVTPNT